MLFFRGANGRNSAERTATSDENGAIYRPANAESRTVNQQTIRTKVYLLFYHCISQFLTTSWSLCLRWITEETFCRRVMMTEAWGSFEHVMDYYGNSTNPGAHFTFNFVMIENLNSSSSAEDFVYQIQTWLNLTAERDVWNDWVVSVSHALW